MTDHVELDATTAAWRMAIPVIDAKIAELQEQRARAVEHVKAAMGDATEARIDGKPVASWAWSKPATEIDRKALERDLPEIAARYTREKSAARPFRILS